MANRMINNYVVSARRAYTVDLRTLESQVTGISKISKKKKNMHELTLYGYEANPRTRIVRIAVQAAAEGIPLHVATVVPRKYIGTNEYNAKFPLSRGKIPALEGPGVKITEVVAIATYIASISSKSRLLGESREQNAEILSWLSWSNQELLPTMATWFLPLIPGLAKPAPYDELSVSAGKTASLDLLSKLEGQLDGVTYLVGNRVTLADVFLAVFLSRGFEWVLDATWRERHPNTMKYFQHISTLDFVKAVIPEFKFIETEMPNRKPANL